MITEELKMRRIKNAENACKNCIDEQAKWLWAKKIIEGGKQNEESHT